MNKSLGVVFAEWRDHVEFELRMRHVLDKAMRLMGNRARTAAWARWREKVEEGRAVKMAMRKFVYGAQAHAFARWREFYADVLTLRRIASAMAHAEHQSLRRCVDKWVAFVEGELDLKEKYKTAALKFFGNVKQKCFTEWVKYTVTMLRVKQLMGNGLRRQAKRALRAWSEEATVAKVLRTKSAFLQQNSAAGVGRRAFRIWIATMRGERHWRLRHSRWAFTEWLETEQRRKEEAMREAKLALVVKRLMFGNLARIFAGWRLIPQRNKRFFRKQQALKRAIAAGDETIKRKRKALVATAWRGWRFQMVDQEKLALVKRMLSKRLGAAKGTFLGRWWTYVEYRRAKLTKFASAKETFARMRQRAAYARWAEATRAADAEAEAKLAKAMEFAFGATLALTVNKWRAVVAESKQKKLAMQRIAALLTGFGLENLALHVTRAWLELARARRESAKRVFRADKHRRAKTLDAAFLSWKVQSQPLSQGDYLKAIGTNADDIWDRDFDDRGDPTSVHAQTLVRRTRAMFDGRDPDFDDEAREDLEAIRLGTPAPSAKKGIVSRVRSRAASLASPQNARASPQNADSDSDDDDAMVTRRARTPVGEGVAGGQPRGLRLRAPSSAPGFAASAALSSPASRSSAPNAASGSRRATRRHARRDRAKALFFFIVITFESIDSRDVLPPPPVDRALAPRARRREKIARARRKFFFFFRERSRSCGKNAKTFGSKKVNGHFLHVRKCASVDREHNRAARSPARGGEGARGGACRCCTGESEPPACCATTAGTDVIPAELATESDSAAGTLTAFDSAAGPRPMMDERERARRQQVAETKRRQRKFEERAKAREMAEADMVRPAMRACTPHLCPGARFANPDND